MTTKQPVDYETYRNIQFDVIATDKGTPALSSPLAPVSIDILDVNDHHPQWDCTERPSDDPYDWNDTCFWNLELRSDILVGFKFIQLKAQDIDLCKSNILYSQITEQSDKFAISQKQLNHSFRVYQNLSLTSQFVITKLMYFILIYCY